MKYVIKHGHTIETVTPSEMEQFVSTMASRQRERDYHAVPGVVALDNTGAGQGKEQLNRQYGWLMERVSITGIANANVAFYLNQQNGSDLLEVIPPLPTSGLYSDSFANRIYVPAGSALVIVVTAGGANGQLSYRLQTRLRREDD